MADNAPNLKMEKLVSLCKRRGFIYPASEIYGGINGFWDYGPLGVLLKNNIRDWWWHCMVECPPAGPNGHPIEMVGLDSAIIQHPTTWIASGHASGFSDPMCTCRQCKKLFRADHVWEMLKEAEWVKSLTETRGDKPDLQWIQRKGKKMAPGLAMGDNPETRLGALLHYMATGEKAASAMVCPNCGGDLTEPRQFNLMFESHTGAVQDESSKVYLRPETAQGIFLNFKNIIDTTRVKVPFGVAQIGKSFRNEVTPRNFIFRSREFEQMEMEWFCRPDEALKWYEFWKAQRMQWWESLGVAPSNLRFRDHGKDELSFYSKMTVDIEYRYPFTDPDFGELEGIAHRGDYDLSQHAKHSGQKLDYFDQELQLSLKEQGVSEEQVKTASRYVPNVIEPASGLTRAVLVLLCEAYTTDPQRPSQMFLKFKPQFAPIKLGIFPLVNKEGMPEVAERLYLELRASFMCEYDAKQSIGKRYARMDEIGTPFCVTVDGQTAQDQTVTVRYRDSLKQDRIAMGSVRQWLDDQLHQP